MQPMKQTFTFYKKGKINSLKSFNSLLRKESDERKVSLHNFYIIVRSGSTYFPSTGKLTDCDIELVRGSFLRVPNVMDKVV